MFGLDPEEAERLRRPRRRLRVWVVVVEVVLAAMACLPFAALDLLYRRGGLQPILDRATAGTPTRVAIDDLEVLPVGDWRNPWSWRLSVTGLSGRQVDPMKPQWAVGRATIDVPEVTRKGGTWGLHWEGADVFGLLILAPEQRPPPPWEPAPSPIHGLRVDEVRIHGATYEAREDDPLPGVLVERIRGTIPDVTFAPGPRELSSGVGGLRADGLLAGAVRVDDLRFPVFQLIQSSLHIEGTGVFGGSELEAIGDVRDFHIKPDVEILVDLEDGALPGMVEKATGRPSPVEGRVTAVFSVRTGGELPRGGAIIEGDVIVRDGGLRLSRRTRYFVLDILRIVPWVRLEADNRLHLEEMSGRIRFTRGTATLKGLTYPVGRRTLRLDGSIGADELFFTVRLMPFRDPDIRPGLGVVLSGAGPTGQLEVRLAGREDLLKDAPWQPFVDEAEREAWRARDAARVAAREGRRSRSRRPARED